MTVYFAPPYRDPNAELKRYMLQFAQMYGDKRTATAERGKLKSFAESISPPDISTINDQRLFSPGGQESLQAALFEGGPAKFGQRPGQQTLSPQQIMQKALLANVPIEKAMQLARTLGQPATTLTAPERAKSERIEAGLLPRATQPKLTEKQQLQAEGYDNEAIRRIFDIKHGIEPRATSRIKYDTMTAVEKAKYLSTEITKAEGQNYKLVDLVGEEAAKARQPEYLAWLLTEREKNQQELAGTKTTADKTIRVIAPDGRAGTVPVSEWESYKAQGFRKE